MPFRNAFQHVVLLLVALRRGWCPFALEMGQDLLLIGRCPLLLQFIASGNNMNLRVRAD